MVLPEQPKLTRLAEAPEVFIDGYQGAIVANGTVKLNCFSVASDPVAGEAAHICVLRLAMSVPTLVQVRDAMSELIGNLQKDGVISDASGGV